MYRKCCVFSPLSLARSLSVPVDNVRTAREASCLSFVSPSNLSGIVDTHVSERKTEREKERDNARCVFCLRDWRQVQRRISRSLTEISYEWWANRCIHHSLWIKYKIRGRLPRPIVFRTARFSLENRREQQLLFFLLAIEPDAFLSSDRLCCHCLFLYSKL